MIKHSVIFEITNKCNLRCRHCYNNFDEERCLSHTDISSFLSMLRDNGERPSVIITGGEPFLYDGIEGLIKEISVTNNVRVNTNGMLLVDYLPIIRDVAGMKIQVSLDGFDNDSYCSVRGYKGFKQVVNNIILARDSGINIAVRATLTRETIQDYERFVLLSKELNVPFIIRPMIYTGMPQQKELLCSEEQINSWIECNLRQLAVIDALVNGRLALKTAVPLINYTFELISTV